MTKYEAKFVFGSELAPEGAAEWAEAVRSKLPEGATLDLRVEPLILDLEDVTEEHAGNRITIRGYFEKLPNGDKDKAKEQAARLVKSHNLTGVLEHVFQTGAHPAQRTLIIDGKAYDIPAYSLVELGEW